MLANDMCISTDEDLTAKSCIKLLERFFTFKDEGWKTSVITCDSDSQKYHFCIRIKNFKLGMQYDKEQKLSVKEVKTQLWDRHDSDGVNFVLILVL